MKVFIKLKNLYVRIILNIKYYNNINTIIIMYKRSYYRHGTVYHRPSGRVKSKKLQAKTQLHNISSFYPIYCGSKQCQDKNIND